MATFVIAHGAWSAGWAWKKMRGRMRDRGHELWTPTYTGLGERAHLATPDVDLDTHIQDVCGVLMMEDLRNVILVGHSYGGMVATGVADREAARIARLVYLDAFVPRDGQSMLDLHPAEIRERMRAAVLEGDGWRLAPNPLPPDTSAEDLVWMAPRRIAQPAKTGQQPIRLTGAVERRPRTYIYCLQARTGDVFRPFAERARTEPGWQYFEIDASHNPHITAPDTLASMLDRIAAGARLVER
jgi:pimeloyl-ACP methyl ester carboxylesterase